MSRAAATASFGANEITLAEKKDRSAEDVMEEEGYSESSPSGESQSSGTRQSGSGKRARRRKKAGSVDGGGGAPGQRRTKASAKLKADATHGRQNSRSRRLVANARERSRIHILSDAFENLRGAVPSFSQDQKLSKLAILKLATYYISALANLAESDTSARSLKKFADCVARCTKALQTEGRARRKQY